MVEILASDRLASSLRRVPAIPPLPQGPRPGTNPPRSARGARCPAAPPPPTTPGGGPRPQILRGPRAPGPTCSEVESVLQDAAGRPGHTLHVGDLRRNKPLITALQKVQLRDYFDERGLPRLQRLGFSFAAKQHDETKDSFGSRVETSHSKALRVKKFSAREAHLASKALEKEASHRRAALGEIFGTVEARARARRLGSEDVSRRQLNMLFQEVPDFDRYLSPEVDTDELLPTGFSKEDELKERRVAERMVANFSDPVWHEGGRMGWLYNRDEVKYIASLVGLWTRAARGTFCALGMDRSTFCRLVLDCGLIDQAKAPLFWAVSLFDNMAQPVRCCPPEATWAPTAAVALVVNRWGVISLLDTIIRQHFDLSTKATFVTGLTAAAKKKFAREFFELSERQFRTNLADEGLGGIRFLGSAGLDDSDGLGAVAGAAAASVAAAKPAFAASSAVHSKAGEHGEAASLLDLDSDDAEQDVHGEVRVFVGHTEDSQAARDAQQRFCSAANMLVEPEVLQMVVRHWRLFEKIHACYADEAGHVHLQDMLQFCFDFDLMPTIVPRHVLTSTYESAVCVIPAPETPMRPVAPILESPPMLRGSKARKSVGRKLRSAEKTQATKEKAKPTFGASAFTETLLRIAFTYLGSYGNTAQQSATGFARFVWVLTYLHNALDQRRLATEIEEGTDYESFSPSLKRMLETVSPEDWVPPFSLESLGSPNLYTTLVHPLPGVGARKVATENMKKAMRETLMGHVTLKPSMYSSMLAASFGQRLKDSVDRKKIMKHGKKGAVDAEGATERRSSNSSERRSSNGSERRNSRQITGSSQLPSSRGSVEASGIGVGGIGLNAVAEGSEDADEQIPTRDSSDSSAGEDGSCPSRPPTNGLSSASPRRDSSTSRRDSSSSPRRGRAPSSSSAGASMLTEEEAPEFQAMRVEELLEMEAGRPCVVNGMCTICRRTVGALIWNNTRCRGCSLVDALAFEYHPFKRLLTSPKNILKLMGAPSEPCTPQMEGSNSAKKSQASPTPSTGRSPEPPGKKSIIGQPVFYEPLVPRATSDRRSPSERARRSPSEKARRSPGVSEERG